MRYFPKRFLILCVFTVAISLAGCKEESASVGLSVFDHYPKRQVLGASVNGEASAPVGGVICCVTIPRKWKPGLTAEVSWSVYLEDDPSDPRNPIGTEKPVGKSAVVEIPEYTQNELGALDVHIYPDDKVRLVVTHWDYRSPFYPLPRAEREARHKIDYFLIRKYCRDPSYYDIPSRPATSRDYKWAKQWGMEDGKCTDPEYLAWEKEIEVKLKEGMKKQQEEGSIK